VDLLRQIQVVLDIPDHVGPVHRRILHEPDHRDVNVALLVPKPPGMISGEGQFGLVSANPSRSHGRPRA